MTQSVTRPPITKEGKAPPERAPWLPFLSLQREINQAFDEFDRNWRPFFQRSIFDWEPLARMETSWSSPAVDIIDKEKSYEITAEVPGMTAENLELKLVNNQLLIRGEKKESREETKGDSHLSERQYGAFERNFRIPDGVDSGKIEATLRNGVLTVVLPKTAEATMPTKKIEVKVA
ncbi:Hsp20/alpha crystallin family protein [Nordella sp. HKS 07]|uniref:Hsp20/alpha crystallin family protein n=1 Tax=Nordella sp. HKS 07 TaxID=2712222 RepID=UPI0013E18CD9|nr:Hsp20/alpha crystallin family protein [Nordella sp. HKS 07]QIG48924.1 Hsp20/alpha crystallin family protein [Nordella sp. HKS 07]